MVDARARAWYVGQVPPPPVPFFRGRQITASESDGLLVIRPRAGHEFHAPPGTSALYLPSARLVAAESGVDPSLPSAVTFRGEFGRVERGSVVTLAPIASDDAEALVRALVGRYGLPRAPRPCAASSLAGAGHGEFVAVVGTYAPGHFEVADFEGVMLRCDPEVRTTLVAGERYHVAGFVDAGAAPGSLVIGYRGPTLRALLVQREHFDTPCPLCDANTGS